jgi:penicillin amidase
MLLALACAATLAQESSAITRDPYGVPHIRATNRIEAFRLAGRAVAQDRLWQMETSRRLARGRMAEVFGRERAASDREVLATSYTDDELRQQFDAMSAEAQALFRSYVEGVNLEIEARKAAGTLPEGYARHGFEPEPWTVIDSVAIAVRLWQQFGRGGAGELRNLALARYLENQPVKARRWDVFDDLIPMNDPRAQTTVATEDDPVRERPALPIPTRAITEAHFRLIPNVGLLELLPGLRVLVHSESDRVAQAHGAVFKAGSYAIVLDEKRSGIGAPVLLSAPQMGFTEPSIVHEMAIDAPGARVAGMNVPGVPGVLIGFTPFMAWGLTSGIADTDDVCFFPMDGTDGYLFGREKRKLTVLRRTLRIKGEPDQVVEQRRTIWGPVIIASESARTYFVRRSAYWMQDMRNYDALIRVLEADTIEEVRNAPRDAVASFNLMWATTGGDIGFRYVGRAPLRSPELDPRLPTPGDPRYDWRGFVPYERMPHVDNPKSGMIANWNNKPAAWWVNGDTPAWGQIFRIRALTDVLARQTDVELAAWSIARAELVNGYFHTAPFVMPHFSRALGTPSGNVLEDAARPLILANDGRAPDGSNRLPIYHATLDALREELFQRHIGGLISPEFFRLAIQPTLVLDALEGKTRFDYRSGRSIEDVIRAAYAKAVARLGQRLGDDPTFWTFTAPAIRYRDQAPIPYDDRGTMIQIVEMRRNPRGRNVLPPGVAESGPHAQDQIALSRAWTYKPMKRF